MMSIVKQMVSLFGHHRLIVQMARREVVGRYRGSVFGLLWSFFNPLLLLTVYTFVFSVVFKARWSANIDSKSSFAIILFVGMIMFQVFSETINRAPSLILSNVNYVKKVVFPLEILPVVSLLAALFHGAVSFLVLLLAMLLLGFKISWVIIFLPIIIIPFLLFILGFAWLLASLGVYIQDVSHSIGLLTTVLMFLTPVFYSVSSLPVRYQRIISLNPIAFVIEQSRAIVIWGNYPNWATVFAFLIGSFLVALAGFAWFQRTRKGFADVL
jgi:lipopolysaccharide transport system permease protein